MHFFYAVFWGAGRIKTFLVADLYALLRKSLLFASQFIDAGAYKLW